MEIDQGDRLADQIDAQQVLEGLQTLPVDYREALLLRFHEGLSVSEVGLCARALAQRGKNEDSPGLAKAAAIAWKQ